ncbi:DinB family protein [Aquisalibacillus elongatus]|uniref:Putative damage-inducible protein DinB n=1 Tax=Aquisalibacillus elongatus TaxID=485577 RepID=A0A3N5B7V3_9BACI|nr:DinB family protein [Aquisalibacillus elongatus]RPF53413.1 putative damage-inducible protein DinB [Aquisalibacillus elongatus]
MSKVQQFLNDWLNHREKLEQLLEQIDDEHVHYKPWDGAMSLGAMALHVATAGDMFAAMVKTEKMEAPDMPKFDSMEEVRQKVKEFTESTKKKIENMTDEELDKQNEAELPQMKGTKFTYLQGMFEHEIHHKGQLFVYARMIGVKEVPFFR